MHETPRVGRDLRVADCWELLATVPVGRLAVSVDAQPEIFPVNFVVDDGTVVFRTAEGTKLAAVRSSPLVAFQADGPWPDDADEAWSVVLKGRTGEVRWPAAVTGTAALPPLPWAMGEGRLIRIVPHEVTGRRVPRRYP